MFLKLLIWINGSAPIYWATCAAALGLLLWSVAACGRRHFSHDPGDSLAEERGTRATGWGFAGLMALAVLIFRWPVLFVPMELNPDETQMASQAMKYLLDFVPWRSVDGTTSGPLNSWLLAIPACFGFEIGFASGRVMGLLCVFGTLGFTYATFRILAPEFYARVGAIPMALFYAYTTEPNFTHYTSEHLPILLMAGGIYFGVLALWGEKIAPGAIFVSALCFGALPWAKFQAGPVGFVGVLALMVAVLLKRKEWKASLEPLALCAAGGLVVAVSIMATVIHGGAFTDFVISYLGLVNHHENFVMPPGEIIPFLMAGPQSFVYLACGILWSAGALIYLKKRGDGRALGVRRPLFWVAGYLIACVFIVFKAGKSYPHYVLFLVHPIGLFCGLLLIEISEIAGKRATGTAGKSGAPRPGKTWVRLAPALAFAVLFFVAETARKIVAAADHPFTGIVEKYRDPPVDKIVELIRQLCPRGERMVIWGWSPRFYVQTRLIQGTRDAIAQMAMFDEYPNHAYYQQRFLMDMKESKPAVFLDTDTPYFPPYTKQEQHGHEKFPELAEYVRAHYRLTYQVGVQNYQERIRIYLRNGFTSPGQEPHVETGP